MEKIKSCLSVIMALAVFSIPMFLAPLEETKTSSSYSVK